MSCAERIRKGALTWCQTPNWGRIGRWAGCQLAASWRTVLDAAQMASTNTFTDLYNQCSTWRKHLHRSYPKFPDINEVIDCAMWEQFCNGITTEREMFRAVTVAVRRHVRSEIRQWKVAERCADELFRSMPTSGVEQIDAAIDRLGIAQQLAVVPVPAQARAWAERASHDDAQLISDAERMAGRRWAITARKVLANA